MSTFIVFEGINGSGKTTQINLLAEWLRQKYMVEVLQEPGSTDLGNEIRRLTKNADIRMCTQAQIFLYIAARKQLIHEVIAPLKETDAIILCDRFVYSTFAYQFGIGFINGTEELTEEQQATLLEIISIDLAENLPDAILWLDLPVQQAYRRKKELSLSVECLKTLSDMAVVQDAYKTLFEAAKQTEIPYYYVDASKDLNNVTLQTKNIILKTIANKQKLSN